MEIYLIRHGIAVERGIYQQDEERPLTDKGIRKTTLVAKKLAAVGLKFDLILTSPLVRAYQTAAILQQIGLSEKIEIFQSLSPNGNMQEWLEWLSRQFYAVNSDDKLALVGHQPDLSQWAEMLLGNSIEEQIIVNTSIGYAEETSASLSVKKAGIIGLKIFNTKLPLGTSKLFLLTSPKWLI